MNTLSRIADNYWLVTNESATVVGVVVKLDDLYIAHYASGLPTALANLDAVTEYVGSDTEHTIDTRLTDELVSTLTMHASGTLSLDAR